MFEYTIYDYLESIQAPPGTAMSQLAAVQQQLLQELMNELAAQGWRIVSWDPEHYRLLLERPTDGRPMPNARPEFEERWYPPQY